jgi:glycosyltransferase involved in cell wall biosynthesis
MRTDEGETPLLICFAGDRWDGLPHSRHHLTREFARRFDVIFVEAVPMRGIASGDRHEWRRAVAKLRPPSLREVEPGLHVLRGLPIPPGGRGLRAAQLADLRVEIELAARRRGLRGARVSWFSQPIVAPLLHRLGERGALFYYQDRYDEFSHVDAPLLRRHVAALAHGAEACIATAEPLAEDLRALGADPVVIPHGVLVERFAQAPPPPPELLRFERPWLGAVGLIDDHMDFDALRALADRLESGTVILIGGANTNTDALRHPRISTIGQRPYEHMPAYVHALDVCLVPFKVNRLTEAVNPIKLREYLAAGRPVVSTPLPEVLRYRAVVAFGGTPTDFANAACAALRPSNDTEAMRQRRQESVRGESWTAVAARIERILYELVARSPVRT